MCDWNHPLKLWQERNVLVWNSEEVERRGGGLHYTELFTATRLLNVLGFYGTLPSLSDPWVIYCANSFWTPPSLIRLKSCQFGYVHWSIFYLFFFPHKIKNKSKKKKTQSNSSRNTECLSAECLFITWRAGWATCCVRSCCCSACATRRSGVVTGASYEAAPMKVLFLYRIIHFYYITITLA